MCGRGVRNSVGEVERKQERDHILAIGESLLDTLSQILADPHHCGNQFVAGRKFLDSAWSGLEGMVPLHQQQQILQRFCFPHVARLGDRSHPPAYEPAVR